MTQPAGGLLASTDWAPHNCRDGTAALLLGSRYLVLYLVSTGRNRNYDNYTDWLPVDVDIRLLQSNIVRSVRLFVWFVYFLSYKNSICKVNNISCKNIIL